MKGKFKLGITGGIGSGKTSVCRVFNVLGIPVFSADTEAKIIMETDPAVISLVNSVAGRDMYISGSLDRAALADMIFKDKELLERINEAVHPAVRKKFEDWSEIQESPYVILEAAILFESGTWKMLDRILTVVAPVEERIERVIKRNQLTREQVLDRIRNQSDDDYKTARSHYVVNNSDDIMIIPEIIRIHEEILRLINSE
jgi:dephospho-CoA kinase